MRFSSLILLPLAVASIADARLFGKDKPVYEDWTLEQAKEFLKAKGIKVKNSDTLAHVQKDLANHADAAASYASSAGWAFSTQVTEAGYAAGNAAGNAARDAAQAVNDKVIDTWSESELRDWLVEQGIISPASTRDQLRKLAKNKASSISSALLGGPTDTAKAHLAAHVSSAQAAAGSAQAALVDTWSESELRDWLVEHGVVAPTGPRDVLYKAVKNEASRLSSGLWGGPTDTIKWQASSVHSSLHARATEVGSSIQSQASEVHASVQSHAGQVHASIQSQAGEVHSAFRAHVTDSHKRAQEHAAYASQKLDEAHDYVFSQWSDGDLRSWLESHGALPSPPPTERHKLLAHVRDAYIKLTGPVYAAWSNSYLHDWLVHHHIIPPEKSSRDKLLELMQKNYYDVNEKIYDDWTDSEMRAWLVKEGVLSKSAAQLKRDKYAKLLDEHFTRAKSSFFESWSDSDLHKWLVDRGYIKSDYQAKRDELIQLITPNFTRRTEAPYLAWPDARIRAKLREYGVDDTKLAGRPSLLQELRVHYVEDESQVSGFIAGVLNTANRVYGVAEEYAKGFFGYITDAGLDADQRLEKARASVASRIDRDLNSISATESARRNAAHHQAARVASSASVSAESVRKFLEASVSSVQSTLSARASSVNAALKTAVEADRARLESSASAVQKTYAAQASSATANARAVYASARSGAESAASEAQSTASLAYASFSSSAGAAVASVTAWAEEQRKAAQRVFDAAQASVTSAASAAQQAAKSAKAKVEL